MCLLAVVGVMLFGQELVSAFGTFQDAIFSIFICQTQRGWIAVFQPFIDRGYTDVSQSI